MVMLKAKYWCWMKVHNHEGSALAMTYIFVRYLSTTKWEWAKEVGHEPKVKRFLSVQKRIRASPCDMWIDFKFG